VILSAVRTPVGRYGGGLAGTRSDDLAAVTVRAAVERAGVPVEQIEDVWLGCANQAGEDNRNVARMAVLLAGLPESVGGVTVNRLCASGLSAIVGATHAVIAGDGDPFVAGGVESMSRAPLVTAKPDTAFPRGDRVLYDTTLGWRFPNPRLEELFPLETMGETVSRSASTIYTGPQRNHSSVSWPRNTLSIRGPVHGRPARVADNWTTRWCAEWLLRRSRTSGRRDNR
jgi:acetyl-CoA acetyltransferase